MGARSERARFLFRSDAGTIDAPTWRRHALWLALLVAGLTAVWLVLRPYAHHDLKVTRFLSPLTIVAYVYLLLYAFAVILAAISFYNLSAKRFRARHLPAGLAGLIPLVALFVGAAYWIQPQVPDVISVWYVIGLDLLLLGVVVWTITVLGKVEKGPVA
jgi:hypothetical protein